MNHYDIRNKMSAHGFKTCKILSAVLIFTAFFNKAQAVSAVCGHSVFYKAAKDGQTVDKGYIAVYFQVDPMSLHYKKDAEGKLVAQLQAAVTVKGQAGVVAVENYLLNTNPKEQGAAATQNIMDLRRIDVPGNGKYDISVTLTEAAFPQQAFRFTDTAVVDMPGAAPFYSDIQLVDTVLAASDTGNAFYTNGQLRLPLFANFIDEGNHKLHCYAELYQSAALQSATEPLVQQVFISKKEGESPVQRLQFLDTVRPWQQVIADKRFNLAALPTGNYYVNVQLHDGKDEILARRSVFFQLINKNPYRDTTGTGANSDGIAPMTFVDLNKTFVAKFTLPQLSAILEMIRPTCDGFDARAIDGFLRRPDDTYMRYFIYNFFLKQNSLEPEKAWKTFSDKVREVNKLFGNAHTPGYKTDRGMTYLKYGKPSDRITVNNESGALPYEIWQYYAIGKQNMEGVFLFYQPANAISEYKLLHSTVNGEMKNAAWRSYLYINGNGGTSSRAGEYIRGR